MSTNNPGTRDAHGAAAGHEPAGNQRWESVSAAMASLPDPSVIAKLASEFFAALPGGSSSATPSGTSAPGPPPLDGSSIPAAASPTGAGWEFPAGLVDELRGTANAPVNAAGTGPSDTSFYFLEPVRSTVPVDVIALSAAPSTPAGSELTPAPGSDHPTPPNNPIGATGLPAQAGESFPRAVSPESPFYFLESSAMPAQTGPALPLTNELFSTSGLPGLQSAPGTPASPSSPPSAPPTERDLRSQVVPSAGATVVPSQAFGVVAQPVPPSAPPYFYEPGQTSFATEPPLSGFEFESGMTPSLELAPSPFDPRLIRRDFPILQEQVHGRPLVWLDNAATTQKPNVVIDRVTYFYRHENSNIHRAAHTLAARATDAYESAREKTRRFLNAPSTREIVFVRGATEGINLVAKSWGHRNVEKDDEILITWLEHHANIVPWQQLCAEKGARLRVAPVDDRGDIILEEYEKLFTSRTRFVAFSHVSNALGTVTPARTMIEVAHRHGALVLLDAAQSVAHMREDVQGLDCDFFVFSGHKIFAPTGIGVVYGKAGLLDTTPPWQGGGNMIQDVTFEKTTYKPAPDRFEAGTGNIADAVGLGAALDYLERVGLENVNRYEHELLNYATAGLASVPGLRMIGTARDKAGVLSFVLDGVRTEDIGKALDEEGIAVRAGHHCAQPILRRFGVESTVRASLALYNTCEDIDALISALLRIQAGRGGRGL